MYHRVARSAAAIAIGGVLALLPGRAQAHLVGTSRSDFVLDGSHVEATLAFARADAAVLAPGGEPDLRALAEHGIDVRADGAACAGSFERIAEVGGDGVEVHAGFACPGAGVGAPHTLDVSLPLLDELPASHVHLIRVTASGKSVDVALRSSGQHAVLVVSPPPRRPVSGLALFGLAALALLFGWATRHRLRSKRDR